MIKISLATLDQDDFETEANWDEFGSEFFEDVRFIVGINWHDEVLMMDQMRIFETHVMHWAVSEEFDDQTQRSL